MYVRSARVQEKYTCAGYLRSVLVGTVPAVSRRKMIGLDLRPISRLRCDTVGKHSSETNECLSTYSLTHAVYVDVQVIQESRYCICKHFSIHPYFVDFWNTVFSHLYIVGTVLTVVFDRVVSWLVHKENR